MKNLIPKGLSLQRRAKDRIPGITQLLSKRPDMFSYGVWPCYYDKAKGVYVWDIDGNKYIDMSIGGIGANILGYAVDEVDNAVIKAIKNGVSSSLNCPEDVELADMLCELHPWAQKVRFARTGGESMAIAIRIARAYTGKDIIAFCGYHGWHDWYISANIGTEDALGSHLIAGVNPAGVPKGLKNTAFPFHYNRLDELKKIVSEHKKNLGAIVMEPIRGEKPKPEFIDGVREIASETKAVLIIDEISAGFRINTGGAHLKLKIEPDIAVFSKALGNGYPIAAVIGKADIMDAAEKTFISSTNWTERTGPSAALATIKIHKREDASKHLIKIGGLVQKGWKKIAKKNSFKIEIGGMLPLSHFSFIDKKAQVIKALFIQLMLKKGFLACTSFYAMFAHTEENVTQYLKAADESFKLIAEALSNNNIDKMLLGKPSSTGFKRLVS
ncbi:MAG: aminotransferase class III-fold pyridoxal phosphate-dependent enzyme [Deltaproteobacteria bacterium]|nr:aminotransferase class III-fold pyridoxal phosphate-dependent enzyme [Deltaproteobacteria bacterium]